MRKDWLGVALASLVLSACTTQEPQTNTPPPQPAYNGPVVEIPGVEPRYELINPATSQDYSVNGKTWRVVKNPSDFSEVGLATWYGDEAKGNRTAIGETYDPDALTAAHLPCHCRATYALPIWRTAGRLWCALTIAAPTCPGALSICHAPPAIV